jgi:RsiW-degrading membrane proteinase PrsW (M82 family)
MSVPETVKVTIPFHRPGLREKLFFLFSGMVVSIPFALFFETLADNLSSSLSISELAAAILSVAILAPLIEELGKAYPMFYRHGENDRSIFTLGFLVGLGFGITEFIEYVFIIGVPFYFRLPGIFFHPASTSIVAYGISRKRFTEFYFVAAALHVSINLSMFFDPLRLMFLLIVAATLFTSWYLYQKTTERFIEY